MCQSRYRKKVKESPCRVSPAEFRALTRRFTALHEGLPPDSVRCQTYRGPVAPIRKLGRVTEIQYRKAVLDGRYPYHHPFAPHAQPWLGIDAQGAPVLWSGRYTVTTHGIEDRSPSKVQSERLPGIPKTLAQLGTLEFIRYASIEDGVTRVRSWRFTGPVTLEHDPLGHLHVLHRSARIKPQQRTIEMAHRKGHRRHNPLKLEGGALGKVAYPVVGAGVVGAAAIELTNRLLSAPGANGSPRLAGYKKAGVEIAAGVLGAFLLSRTKAPGEVVLGIGAGLFSLGALDVFHTFQANRIMASASATTPPVGGTAAGHYAIGAGGLPQGYYGVNRAGCAVGRR